MSIFKKSHIWIYHTALAIAVGTLLTCYFLNADSALATEGSEQNSSQKNTLMEMLIKEGNLSEIFDHLEINHSSSEDRKYYYETYGKTIENLIAAKTTSIMHRAQYYLEYINYFNKYSIDVIEPIILQEDIPSIKADFNKDNTDAMINFAKIGILTEKDFLDLLYSPGRQGLSINPYARLIIPMIASMPSHRIYNNFENTGKIVKEVIKQLSLAINDYIENALRPSFLDVTTRHELELLSQKMNAKARQNVIMAAANFHIFILSKSEDYLETLDFIWQNFPDTQTEVAVIEATKKYLNMFSGRINPNNPPNEEEYKGKIGKILIGILGRNRTDQFPVIAAASSIDFSLLNRDDAKTIKKLLLFKPLF